MSSELSAVVARLESVTSRLEGLAKGKAPVEEFSGSSETVTAFDEQVIGGKLKTFLSVSKTIGGEVSEQGKLVGETFQELKKVLVIASKHQRPAEDVLLTITKPLTEKVNAVIQYCEKRRPSKVFNNLMTVKEGIGCVGWVTVSPKPAPYVKECGDQALFYGNRVIKDNKGKNENHVSWVRAYTETIKELQAYVKELHTTGLVWNKAGSVYSAAASAGAGPPPPPPPAIQPPENVPAVSKSGNSTEAQRANLFASINKGANVTQGLRRITDDMKTHKNPELRGSSIVKAGEVKHATKDAPKFGSATAPKNPVLALQGKKWVVEYQNDKSNLLITDTNPKQSVYVFKCVKSTLTVSGKVNSIILDNCKRVALCFQDVISSAEVINSQGIQVQVLGKCPTVSIDKTDGCQVFLSKDSLKCEIITAKSSEMNICIPPKDGTGDFIERPVPEQFKTVWNGKALVTECSDITS